MSFALEHQGRTNRRTDFKIATSPIHHVSTLHKSTNNSSASAAEFAPNSLIFVQRAIGNNKNNNHQQESLQKLGQSNNDSKGFDFAKNPIQPKLKISQPGDLYEQEADRIADQVMGVSPPDPLVPITATKEGQISCKCNACELKHEEKENKHLLKISRKPSIVSNIEATEDVTNEIRSVRSSGYSSLDLGTKEFMKSQFGYDFSNVRIHTGDLAERSAQSVSALAYTFENNIVFGKGQYAPETSKGRLLLAHELTHVIQQRGESGRVMRFPDTTTRLEGGNLFADVPQPVISHSDDGLSATLYFGQDSFLLVGQNYKIAEGLSQEIHNLFDPVVIIDGHASSEGSEKLNQELSEKRRFAVIAILSSKLIGTASIQGGAYGEKKPAEVEEGGVDEKEKNSKRALNRRVEIKIISKTLPKKPPDLFPHPPEPSPDDPIGRIPLSGPFPQPGKQQTYSEMFWKKLDDWVDSELSRMEVSAKYRGYIKKGAHMAVEKGADAILEQALKNAGLSSEAIEAFKSGLKNAAQTK